MFTILATCAGQHVRRCACELERNVPTRSGPGSLNSLILNLPVVPGKLGSLGSLRLVPSPSALQLVQCLLPSFLRAVVEDEGDFLNGQPAQEASACVLVQVEYETLG